MTRKEAFDYMKNHPGTFIVHESFRPDQHISISKYSGHFLFTDFKEVMRGADDWETRYYQIDFYMDGWSIISKEDYLIAINNMYGGY